VNPPLYTFGNTGRNVPIGPGLFTWDVGGDKGFRMTERFRLQFRSEFFNVLNRANFGLPSGSIGSAAAGTITNVLTNARQIQSLSGSTGSEMHEPILGAALLVWSGSVFALDLHNARTPISCLWKKKAVAMFLREVEKRIAAAAVRSGTLTLRCISNLAKAGSTPKGPLPKSS